MADTPLINYNSKIENATLIRDLHLKQTNTADYYTTLIVAKE